jgi:hypothetical protein
MELMPGDTLNDLVRDKGPLPPDQAIPKILDVIEGLKEAHQVGLVHRDVKPANCFLEADGRVKIGDFGLAKSLLHDSHLTRTGTFLGTPLFAAPEQIKLEGSAVQDDVYSVAATLYFLLTGQAPFQSGDALATIARIVSDDPPSMRLIRPELPKALDNVVLRGLARERKNRWRSLEEFRRALAHFLPAEVSVGGLGLRFGAFLIDSFFLSLARQALLGALLAVLEVGFSLLVVALVAELALPIVYFGILEGLLGFSVGKRMLRLRVAESTTQQPPGVSRALLRAAIISVLPGIALGVVGLDIAAKHPKQIKLSGRGLTFAASGMSARDGILISAAGVWNVLAIIAILSTMRRRNGFRGLHEFASGTRTYLLRWPDVRKRRSLDIGQFLPEMTRPDNLPDKVGPYAIRGALRCAPQEKVLLGQDHQLGRAVSIWLRPVGEQVLGEPHRAVSRMTRTRWLTCGTHENEQWDAFLAPTGCALPVLVARNGRLSWAEFRPILQELTEELHASCTDQSLPQSLSPEQVWINPNGHVQLLETSSDTGAVADSQPATPKVIGDQPRALALLGDLAVATLEGSSLPTRCQSKSIQAPLPLHAAKLVNHLLTNQGASPEQPQYQNVGQVLAELKATDGKPVAVTSWARIKHLIGQGAYALIGLMLIGLLFAAIVGVAPRDWIFFASIWRPYTLIGVVLFFAPAYLMQGGFSFYRDGIVIVLADGRRASRLRCLARAILAWCVVGMLGFLTWAGVSYLTFLPWNYWIILVAAVILLASYLFLTIWSPSRAPHDYLTRTYLVPK